MVQTRTIEFAKMTIDVDKMTIDFANKYKMKVEIFDLRYDVCCK